MVGQTFESVRTRTQQNVTERELSGGHKGGQEVLFHLQEQEEKDRTVLRGAMDFGCSKG